jgi:glutathione S-transferase
LPDYRLHYFPESGNSYKLALMLRLCGEDFEPVWTDFGSGITRTAQWRRDVNPMGEIPVLQENGVTFTQTAPILLRLADRYGRYHGATEAQRQEVLRWLFWDNQKLSGFMAMYRYRRAFTPVTDPAVLAFMRGRLDDFLLILEGQVSRHPYVVGDRMTIADISMIAYLIYPARETGYDWPATHPAINAWLQRVAQEPRWQAPYDLLPGKRLTCYV